MSAIKRLRGLADDIDWHIYNNGGIPRELRSIADEIEAENAKLREELAKARDPQRIGGQADPSSFAYAIEQLREFRWQHATNDEDAIPYINNVAAAHERENAKLREAVATAIKVQAVLCGDADSLYCRKDCSLHRQESDDCLACDVIGIAQELGIEVDG